MLTYFLRFDAADFAAVAVTTVISMPIFAASFIFRH